MPTHPLYTYLSDGISFASQKAAEMRTIYSPLCGIDTESIKSTITPYLGGDIKIDKTRYLTKPVSTEDLRQGLRNFFVHIANKGTYSILSPQSSQETDNTSHVEVGQLWHKLTYRPKGSGLEIEALNFVPVSGEKIELMRVTVKNISAENMIMTPTAAIPLFARTLANKHDHEHVTSLLHRIEQLPNGVMVSPSMVFDERGHLSNETVYYVMGISGNQEPPSGTFPTVDSFYEDSGTIFYPQAVIKNLPPSQLPEELLQGKEAVGALQFNTQELSPNQAKEYIIVMGIGSSRDDALKIFERFNSLEKLDKAFEGNKKYWQKKTQSIFFQTGDNDFDSWMHWVTLQPVLRGIFGCSFLPDHDYGKGSRGWRDIWQDLLSLILIEPESAREDLINYFGGIRIDGSNATLIGSKPGEFIADRNAINRVWMDHGLWPLMTLCLYIHQTGDYDILLEENTYFRDAQFSRAFEKDNAWNHNYGNKLKDSKGKIYRGSILEHVLLPHLVQFYNVGDHNIIRLENADWNDGLDMAFEKGESVAFMSFYGSNLLALADLLNTLSQRNKIKTINLAAEMMPLLDSLTKANINYDHADDKRELLFKRYFPSAQPELSGKIIKVSIEDVISDLRKKGDWIFSHLNENEKVSVEDNGKQRTWFNGYYDNKGKRVEGNRNGHVRVTLTGQVFPIMCGIADEEDVKNIILSVDKYLKDKKLGGIRLNTDFGLRHYLDLGRAFGFAYGTKENGAFFSHMTVMYAYALYKRGFAREGYGVLRSIYRMCVDTDKSKIYPGVPEYFDSQGRGRYHYLTGAASWWVLTLLTLVFGIRGDKGDLLLAPSLVREEFGQKGQAQVNCEFSGKKLSIVYENAHGLDYGEYEIKEVILNAKPIEYEGIVSDKTKGVRIKREIIQKSGLSSLIRVRVDK